MEGLYGPDWQATLDAGQDADVDIGGEEEEGEGDRVRSAGVGAEIPMEASAQTNVAGQGGAAAFADTRLSIGAADPVVTGGGQGGDPVTPRGRMPQSSQSTPARTPGRDGAESTASAALPDDKGALRALALRKHRPEVERLNKYESRLARISKALELMGDPLEDEEMDFMVADASYREGMHQMSENDKLKYLKSSWTDMTPC